MMKKILLIGALWFLAISGASAHNFGVHFKVINNTSSVLTLTTGTPGFSPQYAPGGPPVLVINDLMPNHDLAANSDSDSGDTTAEFKGCAASVAANSTYDPDTHCQFTVVNLPYDGTECEGSDYKCTSSFTLTLTSTDDGSASCSVTGDYYYWYTVGTHHDRLSPAAGDSNGLTCSVSPSGDDAIKNSGDEITITVDNQSQ